MSSLPGRLLSFSLICESIAAQFLTFVPHGEKTVVEEDSPSSRATESSFVRRPANFGNVSPFLVGATNIFSELILPFLKLLKCVLKQQPHILHSSSPRSRHRLCRRATTSTHFFIFQKTLHCTGKKLSRLLWNYCIQRSPQDSKPSADSNTRYSLAKSMTGCIKFTERVGLWIDFWQLDNIWSERTHCTVGFFLSSHTPYGLLRYSYAQVR